MTKIALLFAGQGAQKVGMGQDLFERSERARALLNYVDQRDVVVFSHPQ